MLGLFCGLVSTEGGEPGLVWHMTLITTNYATTLGRSAPQLGSAHLWLVEAGHVTPVLTSDWPEWSSSSVPLIRVHYVRAGRYASGKWRQSSRVPQYWHRYKKWLSMGALIREAFKSNHCLILCIVYSSLQSWMYVQFCLCSWLGKNSQLIPTKLRVKMYIQLSAECHPPSQ